MGYLMCNFKFFRSEYMMLSPVIDLGYISDLARASVFKILEMLFLLDIHQLCTIIR
jgi:hypothetical protein